MLPILIVLTVLLIAIAGSCSLRARSVLSNYRNKIKAHDSVADKLERSEKRWRQLAHVFSLLCLSLVPAMLTYEIFRLTMVVQRTISIAVTAGSILAVLKFIFDAKWAGIVAKPFSKDVSIANELALATLGFLASLILTCAWVAWTQPALRAEFLKQLHQ
jgi:hypothetical protein